MTRGLVVFALIVFALSCGGGDEGETKEIILGATTSLRDSGLLAQLEPAFESAHPGHDLIVIANGTGAAMENAKRGLLDLLLVHSPDREEAFVADGFGLERRPLMESSFLLVGPPADPAGIAKRPALDALRALAAAKARFISRGDNSGTHDRERALWKAAGGRPAWQDYIESGRGMGATLTMASQMGGYTLVDAGTFANFSPRTKLVAFVEGGAALANPYHLLTLPPARRKHGDAPTIDLFANWLLGEEARGIIQNFRIHDRAVFRPGVTSR